MTTEILYTAWNRLEFTRETFRLLLANTDWEQIARLVVYDDCSEDGTLEWLHQAIRTCELDIDIDLRVGPLGGPVAIMNHYVRNTDADWFVKIDNDIAVPPGWLDPMLTVALENQQVDLLGMQAGTTTMPDTNVPYGLDLARWIGGVGLMRVEAFKTRKPISERGRFGFTEWQTRETVVCAWIRPDLRVPQLDRVPLEPFTTWSTDYIKAGWQRPWPIMDARWCAPYYDWLPDLREAAA